MWSFYKYDVSLPLQTLVVSYLRIAMQARQMLIWQIFSDTTICCLCFTNGSEITNQKKKNVSGKFVYAYSSSFYYIIIGLKKKKMKSDFSAQCVKVQRYITIFWFDNIYGKFSPFQIRHWVWMYVCREVEKHGYQPSLNNLIRFFNYTLSTSERIS